jgi:hypothetical protein
MMRNVRIVFNKNIFLVFNHDSLNDKTLIINETANQNKNVYLSYDDVVKMKKKSVGKRK